jgi:hypothetical protein
MFLFNITLISVTKDSPTASTIAALPAQAAMVEHKEVSWSLPWLG